MQFSRISNLNSEENQPFIFIGVIGVLFYTLFILGNLTPYCTVNDGSAPFTAEDYLWNAQQQSRYNELVAKLDKTIMEAEKWKYNAQRNWKILQSTKNDNSNHSTTTIRSHLQVVHDLFEDDNVSSDEALLLARLPAILSILECSANGSILDLGSSYHMTRILNEIAVKRMHRNILSASVDYRLFTSLSEQFQSKLHKFEFVPVLSEKCQEKLADNNKEDEEEEVLNLNHGHRELRENDDDDDDDEDKKEKNKKEKNMKSFKKEDTLNCTLDPSKWNSVGKDRYWSVVFLNHFPIERRAIDLERLRPHGDIFVVFDTHPFPSNYKQMSSEVQKQAEKQQIEQHRQKEEQHRGRHHEDDGDKHDNGRKEFVLPYQRWTEILPTFRYQYTFEDSKYHTWTTILTDSNSDSLFSIVDLLQSFAKQQQT